MVRVTGTLRASPTKIRQLADCSSRRSKQPSASVRVVRQRLYLGDVVATQPVNPFRNPTDIDAVTGPLALDWPVSGSTPVPDVQVSSENRRDAQQDCV